MHSLTMQIAEVNILKERPQSCESCSKLVYGKAIIHWDIVAVNDDYGPALGIYYLHMGCFRRRREALERLDVPVLEFDIEYVLGIGMKLQEARTRKRLSDINGIPIERWG